MAFDNNDTLQKWHMTDTQPKIDKCNTHKKWCFTKMPHLAKTYQQGHMARAELNDFLKGILKLLV